MIQLILFYLQAGLSALNAAFFAAAGNPANLAAAVFCALLAIQCALMIRRGS